MAASKAKTKTHPDPRRGPEFDQILPTLTTWAEVERVIFPNYPPPSSSSSGAHLSFFAAALRYAFFEQRAAVAACVRKGGRIALAYQIANENFENTWSGSLDLLSSAERISGAPLRASAGQDPVSVYESARGRAGAGDETGRVLADPARWWLNGRVVCNIPSRNVWGDGFVGDLLDMLSAVCKKNPEWEADLLLNRRDCALLPTRHPALSSPFPFHEIVGCFSFYTSPSHLDRPMPVVEDWLHICGRRPHPAAAASWEERQPKAVFRGSSTGHACAELNVRVRLTRLGKANPDLLDAGITSVCCRDGIVADTTVRMAGGGGASERKIIISAQSKRELAHLVVPQMSMQQQFDTYRYVVYAPGHSAASRYGALLGSGCAVIRIEDPSCPCPHVWFERELVAARWSPGERRLAKSRLDPEDADHIRASAFDDSEGSVLQAIAWLRENNALAKLIAENASKKHKRIMTLEYAERCFL